MTPAHKFWKIQFPIVLCGCLILIGCVVPRVVEQATKPKSAMAKKLEAAAVKARANQPAPMAMAAPVQPKPKQVVLSFWDAITLCHPSEQAKWRFNVRHSHVPGRPTKAGWPILTNFPVTQTEVVLAVTGDQDYFVVTKANTNGLWEYIVPSGEELK